MNKNEKFNSNSYYVQNTEESFSSSLSDVLIPPKCTLYFHLAYLIISIADWVGVYSLHSCGVITLYACLDDDTSLPSSDLPLSLCRDVLHFLRAHDNLAKEIALR